VIFTAGREKERAPQKDRAAVWAVLCRLITSLKPFRSKRLIWV